MWLVVAAVKPNPAWSRGLPTRRPATALGVVLVTMEEVGKVEVMRSRVAGVLDRRMRRLRMTREFVLRGKRRAGKHHAQG